MHRLDDLCGIDALQVCRGGAEVSVPELALNQIHADALVRQLDGVRMPGLRPAAAPAPLGGGGAAKAGSARGVAKPFQTRTLKCR